MSKISSLNIFVATTPKHIFDIFFDFRTQKKPGLPDFFSDSEEHYVRNRKMQYNRNTRISYSRNTTLCKGTKRSLPPSCPLR